LPSSRGIVTDRATVAPRKWPIVKEVSEVSTDRGAVPVSTDAVPVGSGAAPVGPHAVPADSDAHPSDYPDVFGTSGEIASGYPYVSVL
jgi:hypothetical protein